MTNAISGKEFKEKRDNLFTVVSFNMTTLKRDMIIGSCTYFRAIEEVIDLQKRNLMCLIIPSENIPAGEISWDFSDYLKYTSRKEVA